MPNETDLRAHTLLSDDAELKVEIRIDSGRRSLSLAHVSHINTEKISSMTSNVAKEICKLQTCRFDMK